MTVIVKSYCKRGWNDILETDLLNLMMKSTIIIPDKTTIELPVPEDYIGKKIVVTYTIEEVNTPAPNVAEKVNVPVLNVVKPASAGGTPRTLGGSKTSATGSSSTQHEHG